AASSGGTATDASEASRSCGIASVGSRSGSRIAAAGADASGKPTGWSGPAPGAEVCTARSEGRPDEGLHSAAADDHQQRTRADHAEHHDYRRNLGERPG